ncbi:HEAT repeat domain-containing protein [bacterium]|nr:HEAT repeat domain-containing protein [bacterium]
MNNEVLNYNSILEECGVGKLSTQLVVKNIANLEEFYDSTELISIYNYCLMNIEDSEILIQIIKFSDSYRASSTLSILLEMLQLEFDSNDENLINLRVMCTKAISNYKDASTVTPLLNCLNNKNEHYKVRLACADALGRIGDKYAVKPLIDVVEDENEKSMYLKESATFALGLLGDTSAIDPLVAILESKHGFLGKFSFLKEKIVEALGKLNFNNKKVLKALKNSLMDSSPMVRINAIEAIMNSEDENSINLIKPCLADEDDDVKKNALIALYNLLGRDILDEVISLPNYSEYLKSIAQELIEEYEGDDE